MHGKAKQTKDAHFHVRTYSSKKAKIAKIIEKEGLGHDETRFLNDAADEQIRKRYKAIWETEDD